MKEDASSIGRVMTAFMVNSRQSLAVTALVDTNSYIETVATLLQRRFVQVWVKQVKRTARFVL